MSDIGGDGGGDGDGSIPENSQALLLRVLLGVFLTLLVVIGILALIYVLWRRYRKTKPREPEVIDINLLNLPQSANLADIGSVVSSEGSVAVPAAFSLHGDVDGESTKSSKDTDVESSQGSTMASDDTTDDVMYHAPGFYYE